MGNKQVITFWVIFFAALQIPGVYAQELNIQGDTIFVNVEADIKIQFPSLPNSFYTVPKNATYNVRGEKTSVIVTATVENSKPASLFVSEGGRNHHFILVFKKDINYEVDAELFHDYGTEKKLQRHIQETLLSRNSTGTGKPDLNTPQTEATTKNNVKETPEPEKTDHPLIDNTPGKENDDQYFTITAQAKGYLDQKNYEHAQEAYEKALQLKPGDAFATNQLKKITNYLQSENKLKDQQKLNDLYKGYKQEGDAAFEKNQLTEARIAYTQALGIRQDDPYATKRLKLIEDKEKQQEDVQDLNNNYDAAVQLADKLFTSGDYDNARIQYKKALTLIKKDYPASQVAKIDKIKTDEIAQDKLEKQQLEKDAAITSRYSALTKNADVAFDKKNYSDAKKFYSEASNLKPAEQYPKQRLETIENMLAQIEADLKARNDSIATANETNKKYQSDVNKGRSYLAKNDLLKAKDFYEDAGTLKPLEEEPKNQLEIINNKLAEIEKQNNINKSYTDKIALADSFRNIKAYESAMSLYKDASALKPLESYPRTSIEIIQSDLAEIERTKEYNKRVEEEGIYHKAINNANTAAAEKRYYDAKTEYVFAQKIHSLTETDSIRYSNVLYQIGKKQSDSLSQVALTKNDKPVKSKRKRSSSVQDNVTHDQGEVKPTGQNLVFQKDPLPYSAAELKTKYPNIDFLMLPPDQPFNNLAVSSKESVHIYDSLVLEKPRLELVSSDRGITSTCEGINFDVTTAYFKILIQNNSDSDFLTGSMMLTWARRTGNHIKLYPNHLFPSPLPVIKPGNEAVVIYSCKTYDIVDEESLTFELKDRFKKFNLHINIPGSAYSHEWARN